MMEQRRQRLLERAGDCLERQRRGERLAPIDNALARALRRSSKRVFSSLVARQGAAEGASPGDAPLPLTAIFIRPVGDRCNLSCRYCYQDGIRHLSGHSVMSLDVLDAILRDLSKAAQFPLSIAWHGGEPLLAGKPFFRHAIRALDENFEPGQVLNSVQTNGLLLDEEWFRMFSDARFAVGVSVDGPADLHDRDRVFANGAGSLSFVHRAANLAASMGVPLNAICVVGDQHKGRARDVLAEIDRLQIGNCNIQPSFSLDPSPHHVDPEIFVQFALEFVARWWERGGSPLNVMLIDNLLETILNRAGSDCVFSGRCSQLLAVSHDGDVRPCSRPFAAPYVSLGVASEGLANVAASHSARAFRADDMAAQTKSACTFRELCNQGCPQHRIGADGAPAVDGGNVFCGCTNQSGIGYGLIWEAILSGAEQGRFPH